MPLRASFAKKCTHMAHICPSVHGMKADEGLTRLCNISDHMKASETKLLSVKKQLPSGACTHIHTGTHTRRQTHTRFLLSLSDLIRVTGALPIGCESGPLLPRAANFPYSTADRKL